MGVGQLASVIAESCQPPYKTAIHYKRVAICGLSALRNLSRRLHFRAPSETTYVRRIPGMRQYNVPLFTCHATSDVSWMRQRCFRKSGWESLRESKLHATPSESVRPFHFRSLNQ